jgi:hypothetical protein
VSFTVMAGGNVMNAALQIATLQLTVLQLAARQFATLQNFYFYFFLLT